MRPILLVVTLCACGSVDFTGIWAGSLTNTVTCNGATTNDVGTVRWALAQRGDDLTVTPEGGNCGSFTADVMGDVATMRAKSCASGVSFTGGRFELNTVDKMHVSIQATNGTTCSARSAGVLDLQ